MSKQASSSSTESVLSIQVPKKLGGKKFVLADTEECAKTKRRLGEIEDTAKRSLAAGLLIVKVERRAYHRYPRHT